MKKLISRFPTLLSSNRLEPTEKQKWNFLQDVQSKIKKFPKHFPSEFSKYEISSYTNGEVSAYFKRPGGGVGFHSIKS